MSPFETRMASRIAVNHNCRKTYQKIPIASIATKIDRGYGKYLMTYSENVFYAIYPSKYKTVNQLKIVWYAISIVIAQYSTCMPSEYVYHKKLCLFLKLFL